MSDNKKTTDDDVILLFDLYCLRFIFGKKWYRLTDVIRDYLNDKGFKISYTKDDIIFKNPNMVIVDNEGKRFNSIKKVIESHEQK